MNIIEKLFAGPISRRVNTMVASVTANLYQANVFRFLFDGEVVMQADNYDYIKHGFEQVGAVYECVDIIVKKIIACPRIVYRVKDQKEYKKYLNYSQSNDPGNLTQLLLTKAKAMEEVAIPQIEKLLNNPNPYEDGDATFEMLAALYLLKGNAYLYGNAGTQADRDAKKWSEMWAIPGQMRIISGGFMEPIKEYILQQYVQDRPFPEPQIKHFKTLNPQYRATGQQLYGTSPLQPYIYSMDILKNADRQADKQMKNGGKLGLVSPENKEDSFSQPQIDQLGDSLKTAHKGTDELSRMVPLSIAVKWTEIGLSSAEMELLKTSDAKADDIYRCFHIPLQFRNQDTATYNNLPVANRQLVYNAVAPICRRFSKGLTDFICTPYNTSHATYVIELDYTSLPELHDDTKAIVEWLMLCDFLTPNEKREVIGWGRSAEPGMDAFFLNRNKVLLSDILAGKINQAGNTPQAGDTNAQGDTGVQAL